MSPRNRRLRLLTLTLLVLGAAVMIIFDRWYTLLAGVILMFAFVVSGTFLIADPDGFLDRDAEGEGGEVEHPERA